MLGTKQVATHDSPMVIPLNLHDPSVWPNLAALSLRSTLIPSGCEANGRHIMQLITNWVIVQKYPTLQQASR